MSQLKLANRQQQQQQQHSDDHDRRLALACLDSALRPSIVALSVRTANVRRRCGAGRRQQSVRALDYACQSQSHGAFPMLIHREWQMGIGWGCAMTSTR